MPNWIETLKGDTQARLLRQLRRTNQSITELVRHLGLTDNAVRTHIAVLEREGLVEAAGSQRATGGKPARLYALTREGEELFPKAYALVLGHLIEEIARREGDAATIDVLREVGRRVSAGIGTGKSPDERVVAAAATLRSLGGELSLERQERGWTLQGVGCPLSAVTRNHPETCALAQALVEEITGFEVSECCLRGERPRCRFQISEPATGGLKLA